MILWYVLGGVLLLVLLRLTMSARKYARIFAGTHYAQVADGLGPARDAAATRAETPREPDGPPDDDDPRFIFTDQGLAVGYSVVRTEPEYVHHLSVSMAGGYTPRAVGETFTLFVAEAMAWPMDRARFFVSEHPVYHGEVRLTEAEHGAWAAGPAPTAADTEVFIGRAAGRGELRPFPRVDAGHLPGSGG